MHKRLFWLLLILVLAVGCEQAVPSEPVESARHLIVLYTNDEHGWIAGDNGDGGAAHMMGLWQSRENYTLDGPFLVLSGGDMWTGPAVSSWFEGESTAEVLNAMGYDAAAVGNHEFDFGRDGLRDRVAQSEFPFLTANVREKATGRAPDFALPFIIQEVNGVRVGVIGLSTVRTPRLTMPTHVEGLDFLDYEDSLAETVPLVRADGAELLIVISHLCSYEMQAIAPSLTELGVALIGGGHCHEEFVSESDGVWLIESGAYLENYVRVDIDFDSVHRTVSEIQAEIYPNQGGTPDPEIAVIVEDWQAKADEELEHVIGYLEKPLAQRSPALMNLVTDAWLDAYPEADVALTNQGGFRQGMSAGAITLGNVVDVLPFDNVLLMVEITGAQLIESIECESCRTTVGGMTAREGYQQADGKPIDPERTYRVLITDFMYAGGDGYRFQEFDSQPHETYLDWRQPVIEWIVDQNTDVGNPLNPLLDATWRQ